MNISWLTFRDLEYLVSVAKHLHFGMAAKECHVSQPALSTQIKKLEDRFGVVLFERSNRKVQVTAAGRALAERARALLEQARQLEKDLPKQAGALEGNVSIGAIASLGPFLIPLILPKLRKAFPKAKFYFREGLTDELLKALKAGEIDFVLAADTFEDPSLSKEKLFFEPFYLAVAHGHPLETKKPLVLRDLHTEEMVLLEDGHCLKDQAIELCSKGKGQVNLSLQATSIETLRHLVAAGLGYTLLPALAVEKDRQLSKLIAYRTLPSVAGRDVILVTRKQFVREADTKALVASIRDSWAKR